MLLSVGVDLGGEVVDMERKPEYIGSLPTEMPHPLSSHWVKRLTIFFSSTGPGCILARVGEIRGGEGEGEVWGQLSKEDKGGAAGAVTDFRLLDGEKCYFLLKS